MGLLKTVLIRAKRDGYPVSINYQFIDSFGLFTGQTSSMRIERHFFKITIKPLKRKTEFKTFIDGFYKMIKANLKSLLVFPRDTAY